MQRKTQNPKSNPAPPKRLVIDESVSSRQVDAFIRFCAKRRIVCESQLRLAESHPGISDDLVIHHLLGPQTLLLTTDRPFHNKSAFVSESPGSAGERHSTQPRATSAIQIPI